MANAGDIREILDIPADHHPSSSSNRPPAKKVRIDPGPRLTGFQREVQSLMSDSINVPPIPIVDNARYKAKPAYAPRAFRTRRWAERRFVNSARTDGLELRHWKYAVPPAAGQRVVVSSATGRVGANGMNTDGDAEIDEGNMGQQTPGNEENGGGAVQPAVSVRYEDEFPMEKFNVKVTVPTYTHDQYLAHFQTSDWTEEETNYLMGLLRDFDMRWIVVADRYDPTEVSTSPKQATASSMKDSDHVQPKREASNDAMDIDSVTASPIKSPSDLNTPNDITRMEVKYPQRSLESLKARYYTIASKMLSINTPPDTMTPSEFALWEKMKNFDGRTEEVRKAFAEKLFMRTKEEADEERILLEELARITKNEEEFLKLRRDLYQRLESPVLSRRADDQSTSAIYQSSQGLGALLSNLMFRDKRLKRPGMIDTGRANLGQDANGEAERGTAGTATDKPRKQTWEKGQHPNQYTARRNTMDAESASGDPPKKSGMMAQTPSLRTLTPSEEAKYGVAHPQERITSGVQFRHEKASKVVVSKSAAQMAKLQAALVELGIPLRLLMPTEKVCREYERLVADIVLLVDARRGVERISTEVKILEESRRIRLCRAMEDDKPTFAGQDVNTTQEGGTASQLSAPGHGPTNGTINADTQRDANQDTTIDAAMQDGTPQRAPPATNEKSSGATSSIRGGGDANGDGNEGDDEDRVNVGAEDNEDGIGVYELEATNHGRVTPDGLAEKESDEEEEEESDEDGEAKDAEDDDDNTVVVDSRVNGSLGAATEDNDGEIEAAVEDEDEDEEGPARVQQEEEEEDDDDDEDEEEDKEEEEVVVEEEEEEAEAEEQDAEVEAGAEVEEEVENEDEEVDEPEARSPSGSVPDSEDAAVEDEDEDENENVEASDSDEGVDQQEEEEEEEEEDDEAEAEAEAEAEREPSPSPSPSSSTTSSSHPNPVSTRTRATPPTAPTTTTTTTTRLQKRSASVISESGAGGGAGAGTGAEGSRAGSSSNRSGVGRKKGRRG